MIRRWYYLLAGFTFPFFWAFHAAGKLKILYYPIQMMASTKSTGWPSFITATLLYLAVTVVFEIMYRTRKDLTPE